MTNQHIDENMPPIEPLDLSEISSEPVRIKNLSQDQDAPSVSDGTKAQVASVAGTSSNNSSEQEVLIRKRKRRDGVSSQVKKKRRRKVTIVVALVAVLIALIFATAAMGGYALRHGGLSGGGLLGTSAKTGAVTYDEGRTVEYNGATYAYKENMVSILLIGYDARQGSSDPAQADAIMLMALDPDTGKITGIAVPRDSMVEVDAVIGDVFTGVDTMQLCLAFSYGDGGATSCEYTARAVSRIMYNIPISTYFALNMQGVAPLNDAIGGVALTPLSSVPDAGIYEGVPTVLQGSQALRYVQSRGDELDASLNRQARQVQYVKAFASQALEAAKGDVGVLLDLYRIAGDYSTTNLSLGKFTYLANKIIRHGVSELETTSLPGTMIEGYPYAEFYIDYQGVFEIILNTYYVKIDDGTAGAASTTNAAGATSTAGTTGTTGKAGE